MTHDRSQPDDNRSGPRTLYVDFADLEARMTSPPGSGQGASERPRRRILRRVDDEVDTVRANVKDAARAVAEWVAGALDHDNAADLDRILDKCLRPGPDVTAVNFAALAEHINEALGINLSAKRVQTAVEHLRRGRDNEPRAMASTDSVKLRLDALHDKLAADFDALTDGGEHDMLNREVATTVLGAVRAAAARVIDCDYGEGIPREVDIDQLETDFLHFVRDMVNDQPAAASTGADLRKLLITLGEYDGSAGGDMRLVVDGARVTAALAGPDSLPGVMAQLNVLVAGRNLIETELYCAEMDRLALAAAALHDDAATQTYMNWVRRLDEAERVPSPLRVASYCRNNAATHILDRLFTGELADDHSQWLARAAAGIETMAAADSGFELIRVTQAIYFTVVAKLGGSADGIEGFFRDLGPDKTLDVVEALIRYENCDPLVDAARAHAAAVFPKIKRQLIHVR